MNRAALRGWWRTRREDVWALSVILIFFAVFFHPVVFGGKFFVINDAFVEFYPLRTAAFAELRQGRLPLWTPLLMSGYPLLSMSHIGLAYPLTWCYLFLPGRWAEQVYTITPYLLTPAFIYAYAREIKRSRLAALLAGLSFSYGGLMVSAVANNGLLPNAVMWLPLMLIAIDRARTQPFVGCLLGATGAYAMSVLSGVGQGFLYVGVIAVGYALFLVLAANSLRREGEAREWKEWKRWHPLAVALAALPLSAGVAAFQMLETMRAARHSIRSVLSYELFTQGSYTLALAFKAFLFPLHYVIQATPCMPIVVVLLAAVGVIAATRNLERDVRIFFWLAVAIVAWILMLGANTPIYRVLYYIPFINDFRVPARHAFEWTFAIAILSAYGWDAAKALLSRAGNAVSRRQSKKIIAGLLLLALSVAVYLFWQKAANHVPAVWDESSHYPQFPESRHLFWKLLFTLLTLTVVWLGWKIAATRWRVFLLTAAIALACFAEPAIMASRWWWPALKTAERFTVASPATKFLQAQAPEQNRIYTRTLPWAEEMNQQPRLDASNLTMLHGLRNAGGYEPLILERYSRALGNVSMDATTARAGFKQDRSILEPQSHVLDILNTTYLVGYADLSTEPTALIEKQGFRFSAPDILQEIKPGETTGLEGTASECDTVALVTSLAYSGGEADGARVAKLHLFTSDGRVIERELLAGVDTAEWAHDRADVLPVIRHQLAPLFDSFPGDESNSFVSHRYWTRIPLGGRVQVDKIEITNISPRVILALWKITLYDSATKFSIPLPHYDLNRWKLVYEKDGVEIIRNKRMLPRVWLVAEAEAVDGEEALSRIRGESEHPFDPLRTALLEVLPSELPRLPGGGISPDSSARVLESEPNRLLIETRSATPTVLVVSEVIFPGWVATVDEQDAPIHATDFILRGVALPAGTHRVEMRYTAPAAHNGAVISLFTLFLIGGLAGWRRGKNMAGKSSRLPREH